MVHDGSARRGNVYVFPDGKFPQGRHKSRTFDIFHEGKELSIDLDAFLDRTIKRLLTNAIAWRELCGEYKIDPEALIKDYPHYDVLQFVLLIVDGAAGVMGQSGQPTHEEIQKELEEMRATIEHVVKQWE